MNSDTGNRCPSQLDLPVPTAILVQPLNPVDHIGPGSWANREENFAGALLHYDDEDLKYVEVQVRFDGPLASHTEDRLKLTFEGDDTEIAVWDSMDEGTRNRVFSGVNTGDDWDYPFTPFYVYVEGTDESTVGHTELVLGIGGADPGAERLIEDRVVVVINK